VKQSPNDKMSANEIGTAGSSLDQVLAGALNTERATAIHTFATKADPFIQKILASLYAAARVYRNFLNGERVAVDTAFATYCQTPQPNPIRIGTPTPPTQEPSPCLVPTQNLSLAEATDWTTITAQVAANETAITRYVAVLNTIACVQQQLQPATVAADAIKTCAGMP